jgi:hypothetical protein
MQHSVFDEIRAATRLVADRARHVRINPDHIDVYADSLPFDQAIAPSLDPKSHYIGDDRDTLAFFLTLDTINFGSGYFPHLKKRRGMSGYFTIASSLTDHYRAHGPIPPHRLAEFSADDCAALFGQDRTNPAVSELMQLFATALNDLGQLVMQSYGGLFTSLVESANHSAEKLVRLLSEMKFFRDVERYGELNVPFYKRAQLTAADLSLALRMRGLGKFDDLDRLTIFADNLVPHVLRIDGILEYETQLSQKIDREDSIPPGSEEEIEIRACAVDAVERLADSLTTSKSRVTAAGLDYVLWNRGQGKYYKTIKPRHRTRSVFY